MVSSFTAAKPSFAPNSLAKQNIHTTHACRLCFQGKTKSRMMSRESSHQNQINPCQRYLSKNQAPKQMDVKNKVIMGFDLAIWLDVMNMAKLSIPENSIINIADR